MREEKREKRERRTRVNECVFVFGRNMIKSPVAFFSLIAHILFLALLPASNQAEVKQNVKQPKATRPSGNNRGSVSKEKKDREK
jgi:hypothetical protein